MTKLLNEYKMAEDVKTFIKEFAYHIKHRNVNEIENDYSAKFPKLTEQYFTNTRWPSIEMVIPLVGEDRHFLMLYRELFYRHIYAHNNTGLTVEDMCNSYANYLTLFKALLDAPQPLALELPSQWLWDIIDEFIYQFQKFNIVRSRPKHKPDEEIQLKENYKVWSIHSVLNILHNLVDKSNINEQLQYYATACNPDDVAGEFGKCPLYKMLGFFSLIGLCRLHVHLGDYFKALSVLKHIELSRLEMYHDVPTCHITTGYYVGFAYMMMRRYQEAIRSFSLTLTNVSRAKAQLVQLRPDVAEYVGKQADQMSSLLGICFTLSPAPLDQAVEQGLRDKCAESLVKLQRMDLTEFVNSFEAGCPKFISPEAPPYAPQPGSIPGATVPPCSTPLEAHRQQVELFKAEMAQQLGVPRLRSYLKLYTTLPTAKLAGFLETDEMSVHMSLMCFKHKLKSQTCTGGTDEDDEEGGAGGGVSSVGPGCGNTGDLPAPADLDFYVDGGMVHVADTKVDRRFSEYFIRQIEKLQQINGTLDVLERRMHDHATKT